MRACSGLLEHVPAPPCVSTFSIQCFTAYLHPSSLFTAYLHPSSLYTVFHACANSVGVSVDVLAFWFTFSNTLRLLVRQDWLAGIGLLVSALSRGAMYSMLLALAKCWMVVRYVCACMCGGAVCVRASALLLHIAATG